MTTNDALFANNNTNSINHLYTIKMTVLQKGCVALVTFLNFSALTKNYNDIIFCFLY